MSRLLPADAQTYSKSPDRYPNGCPLQISRAEGAWVFEQSGKKWLDLTSGLGSVILGHRDPSVDRALMNQIRCGIAFPLPSYLDSLVAEKLISLLTWDKAESVRFGKNGADVTGAAVKLARHITGRKHILYADYHGHHPWSMIEPPMNGGVLEPYSVRSSRDRLTEMVNQGIYSCVVLEPWPSNDPEWTSTPKFWSDLRDACDRTCTLLILDEMVSGFRCAEGGGAQTLQIEPDIACYGKAMANGMPLSAIVGPYDMLKHFEDRVFFSTTHGGEAMSLAASYTTMSVIQPDLENEKEQNVLQEIAHYGTSLIEMCRGMGIEVVSSYPQRLIFRFTSDQLVSMAANGVLCAGYANLTLAHCRDRSAQLTLRTALEAVASPATHFAI